MLVEIIHSSNKNLRNQGHITYITTPCIKQLHQVKEQVDKQTTPASLIAVPADPREQPWLDVIISIDYQSLRGCLRSRGTKYVGSHTTAAGECKEDQT